MEELEQQQRTELKEFMAKCTKMKKSASNKQMKKQVQEEIGLLETELKSKHQREKQELLAQIPTDSNVESLMEELVVEPKPTTVKKPNKSKRRQDKKVADLERQREEAALEAQKLPDLKDIENRSIDAIVLPMNLHVQEVFVD